MYIIKQDAHHEKFQEPVAFDYHVHVFQAAHFEIYSEYCLEHQIMDYIDLKPKIDSDKFIFYEQILIFMNIYKKI